MHMRFSISHSESGKIDRNWKRDYSGAHRKLLLRKLDSHIFKGCEYNEGVLAWSHGIGQEVLVERLCGRYDVLVLPLFQVSPCFRQEMGSVKDTSMYLRRYRGLQTLICFAIRVNIIIGETKGPHMSVRDEGIGSWDCARALEDISEVIVFREYDFLFLKR